jgi:conjugative relaxase-like TrwC/TraI family protein
MLRITESDSGETATKYFDRALATADYYAKDPGLWGGRGAEMLGVAGVVSRDDFIALASNTLPGTNQKLTVRNKEERRAGYDFCFSVPKSVSLYLAETGHEFVEKLAREAFAETMADIEARMETRVRIGGPDRDRITGNAVYAWFVHRETRPIDGIPDPHFHFHAYVFNATFDAEEQRWKAGQFGNLKADGPFYEAAFHARLASKLLAAGYPIRRTDRDFELASVSRAVSRQHSVFPPGDFLDLLRPLRKPQKHPRGVQLPDDRSRTNGARLLHAIEELSPERPRRVLISWTSLA